MSLKMSKKMNQVVYQEFNLVCGLSDDHNTINFLVSDQQREELESFEGAELQSPKCLSSFIPSCKGCGHKIKINVFLDKTQGTSILEDMAARLKVDDKAPVGPVAIKRVPPTKKTPTFRPPPQPSFSQQQQPLMMFVQGSSAQRFAPILPRPSKRDPLEQVTPAQIKRESTTPKKEPKDSSFWFQQPIKEEESDMFQPEIEIKIKSERRWSVEEPRGMQYEILSRDGPAPSEGGGADVSNDVVDDDDDGKKVYKRKNEFIQKGRIVFPSGVVINSRCNFVPQQHQDYEELFFNKSKAVRTAPYYEVMQLGDGTYLHFMKLTTHGKRNFYMSCFDFRTMTCDICERHTNGLHSLIRHRNLHFFDSGSFRCCACKTDYESYEVLSRHVLVCSFKWRLGKNKCKYCGLQFNSYDTLNLHEKRHAPVPALKSEPKFDCDICDKSYAELKQLVKHKKDTHKAESYQCAVCLGTFFNKRDLSCHLVKEHFPQLADLHCHLCAAPCLSGPDLRYHYKMNHGAEQPLENMPHDKRMRKFKAPSTVIRTQTSSIPTTVEDFEQLYWERHKKYKWMPVYEILTLGDGTELHFLKLTMNVKGKFYMANFDLTRVSCDICGVKTGNMSSLLKHRNLHFFERNELKCLACLTPFDDYEVLLRHVCVCRDKTRLSALKCKFCSKEFRAVSSVRTHEMTHVPELQSQRAQPQVCEICSKLCRDMTTLVVHKRRKHQIGAYECNECDKTFGERQEVYKHLVRKHFPSLATCRCESCGLPFVSEGALRTHFLQVHTDKKVQKCPVCQKLFRGSIWQHMQRHQQLDARRKFYCDICNKIFFTLSSMETHRAMHIDPEFWQFACEVCGKKLPTKARLAAHIKLHSNPPEATCPVCQKIFSSKQYLKDHMNLHSGAKPYICNVPTCGKSFADRGCLRSHLKQHEANMGVKLTLSAEERRLQKHGVINIELPGGMK